MTRSWFDEWSELKFLLSGWVSINPRNHIQIKWFTNRVVYFSAGSSRMPRIAYGSNKKRSFFASKWDNKWSECSKDSLEPQLMGLPMITISTYLKCIEMMEIHWRRRIRHWNQLENYFVRTEHIFGGNITWNWIRNNSPLCS